MTGGRVALTIHPTGNGRAYEGSGYTALATAVLKDAYNEYRDALITGQDRIRRSIEKWFMDDERGYGLWTDGGQNAERVMAWCRAEYEAGLPYTDAEISSAKERLRRAWRW